MQQEWDRLENCLRKIRTVTDFVPRVGIVLGSGLGKLADRVQTVCRIPYQELPDFPVSEVSGHGNAYIFGYIDHIPVVLMQGRVHMYEGYSAADAVLPVRLMIRLGAKNILLSNAAGGIAPTLLPPALMLITDHIASFVPSPLRGKNIEELGIRFPDMSQIYDRDVGKKIKEAAKRISVPLAEGIYLQAPGPQYETPAEIRMYAALGADAVGMSTAIEAIAARHMGARVVGISCISNSAAGMQKTALNHKEVQEAADRISESFIALAKEAVYLLNL